MSKTKINCQKCGIEKQVETKEIKRGFGKFCSKQCANAWRITHLPELKHNVVCAHCNKSFHLPNSKLNNSKSKLYFCCRAHKDISQRIGGLKEIMPSHYGDTSSNYRDIVFNIHNKPKICERCNYSENEAAIIVHHKDEDRNNNSIENLEVLCCNCHAIEHWS